MTNGLSTPPPLRLGPLLREGARALWANRRSFVALAAIPVLYDTITQSILFWIYGDDPRDDLFFLVLAGALILGTIFYVGIIRALLVGPSAIHRPIHVRWGRREWLTLLYSILFAALCLVILAAFLAPLVMISEYLEPTSGELDTSTEDTGTTAILTGLVLITAIVVLPRFYFIFPAIALNKKFGFRRSWHQTRGIFMLLAGAVGLTLLIGWAIESGIDSLEETYRQYGVAALVALNLFGSFGFYCLSGAMAAVVALAYKQRVGLPVQERSA